MSAWSNSSSRCVSVRVHMCVCVGWWMWVSVVLSGVCIRLILVDICETLYILCQMWGCVSCEVCPHRPSCHKTCVLWWPCLARPVKPVLEVPTDSLRPWAQAMVHSVLEMPSNCSFLYTSLWAFPPHPIELWPFSYIPDCHWRYESCKWNLTF